MKITLKTVLAMAAVAAATQAAAQVVFYENDGYQGRSFSTDKPVGDLQRYGFNDRASSAVVLRDRWEVCTDAAFGGRCVVLRPGRYGSLSALGIDDRISSARVVGSNVRLDEGRYAPPPEPVYDNHRRRGERLYEAEVGSVRAVVGPPERRCWVEHEQVAPERGGANVPGAIAGALLGGILGHQIGGGRGKDLATAGGAVAGAAVGANVGRDGGGPATTRDVQRCADTPGSARPAYWDVTYTFRGRDHRIQMAAPPGRTITVNGQGEPRG
jgi:uncharacterized protein YcfJ